MQPFARKRLLISDKVLVKTKFLSLEQLLGPLHKLNLKGINWAIVAGESGPAARPLESTCARRQPLASRRARDGQHHQGKARR
jgi:protein gp37